MAQELHAEDGESQEPKKPDDPVTAANKTAALMFIVLGIVGGFAFLAAWGDAAATLVMNRLAATSAIFGVCCLLIADLISIWSRKDADAQMQPPAEPPIDGGSRGAGRPGALVKALFSFKLKEYKKAVEQDQKDQETAEKEAQDQRDRQEWRAEQELRAADAKERWLFRGHCLVVIAAIFVAVGAFLPSSDSETNDSEPSPTESPEPSATPTGP